MTSAPLPASTDAENRDGLINEEMAISGLALGLPGIVFRL